MIFNYEKAFSRNIGWLTPDEQLKLKKSKIAIAGLGGVGGAHLLTLVRLGIGNFNISDFDSFDVHNLNRQAGAFMSSMGVAKLEAMTAMAADVNPDINIKTFPDGIQLDNVEEFLHDVDVYVDALDFFALPARRMVFAKCREKGIPALTAAPLGMGTALLYFSPNGMSFEDYFKMEGHGEQEQYARFIAGLSPAMLNRNYLVAPESVNFQEKRGPSTIMACDLCAGVVGTSVLKLLLDRGVMKAVPWGMQFDAYHQKLKFTWRPWGNSNPLQQFLLRFIRPILQGRVDK